MMDNSWKFRHFPPSRLAFHQMTMRIDYKKFVADSAWDGLKGFITNTTIPQSEVIESYYHIWKIEKAFRISKTDLEPPPTTRPGSRDRYLRIYSFAIPNK